MTAGWCDKSEKINKRSIVGPTVNRLPLQSSRMSMEHDSQTLDASHTNRPLSYFQLTKHDHLWVKRMRAPLAAIAVRYLAYTVHFNHRNQERVKNDN